MKCQNSEVAHQNFPWSEVMDKLNNQQFSWLWLFKWNDNGLQKMFWIYFWHFCTQVIRLKHAVVFNALTYTYL